MSGFFDLEDNDGETIGQGLLKKNQKNNGIKEGMNINTDELQKVGDRTGFSRKITESSEPSIARRRGRPSLNEEMTYWRIYVKPSVRDSLCKLRDQKGVRLNDLLEQLLQNSNQGD